MSEEPAHSAETVAERVAGLTALLQWQIVHNGHAQRWGERNPGLWWCMDCHTFAPTQFDGSGRTDG